MAVPDLVARIPVYGVLIETRASKRQKVEPEILGAVICSELPPAPKTPSDLPQLP